MLIQNFGSIVDLLRQRAKSQPESNAFIFLSDRGNEARLSFGGLLARAETLAKILARRARRGERAILLFPTCAEYLVAFFACLIAGLIAVPIMLPRRTSAGDASESILRDCSPQFWLTTSLVFEARPDLKQRLAGIEGIFVDRIDDATTSDYGSTAATAPTRADIAFLQYTSGSTSNPKGVVVTHGNLLANSEMIRLAFGNNQASTYVSWLPLYHDMGLILNALQAIYLGATCVLMPPVRFIQRPMTWLRAIHEYRGEVAGAPNFAYDLCVEHYRSDQLADVDLSGWKVAFNGAETVRAETIDQFSRRFASHGFSAKAMYAGYGMAEATLLIAGGRRGAGPTIREISRSKAMAGRAVPAQSGKDIYAIVGCGKALAGEVVAIVDPQSRRRLAPNEIGEVWVQGANVARAYWGRPDASKETFEARIFGESGGSWLRTGDLGFLDRSGELFLSGRIKETIIIRGNNYYPADIEAVVQASHPGLRRNCGAAFSVPGKQGTEALIIVQEVKRTIRDPSVLKEIAGLVREATIEQFDVAVQDVALIRQNTLPKTTSGKIQRSRVRELWSEQKLDRL